MALLPRTAAARIEIGVRALPLYRTAALYTSVCVANRACVTTAVVHVRPKSSDVPRALSGRAAVDRPKYM